MKTLGRNSRMAGYRKISSISELENIKKAVLEKNRESADRKIIHLCAGGGCIASGSLELKKALLQEAEREGINLEVKEVGCLGPCAKGPVIKIMPDGVFYEEVGLKDARTVVLEHIKNNRIVESLVHRNVEGGKLAPYEKDIDFFKGQQKIVLRNCGNIDPLSIRNI